MNGRHIVNFLLESRAVSLAAKSAQPQRGDQSTVASPALQVESCKFASCSPWWRLQSSPGIPRADLTGPPAPSSAWSPEQESFDFHERRNMHS